MMRCTTNAASFARRSSRLASAWQAALLCRLYATLPLKYTNLVRLQQNTVQEHASRNCFGVRSGNTFKWITYAEFGKMVDNVRGGLAAAGVGPGNAVAVISNNRIEWAAVAYAALGLGAHIVPMYEVQAPKDWHFIIQDSGAVMLCVANKSVLPVAQKWIDEKSTSLKALMCFQGDASEPTSFAHCIEVGKAKPVPAMEPESDTLATLIYTSGTTGKPKGVQLTHKNITSNVNSLTEFCNGHYTNEMITLSFLPWAHVYGQTNELHHCLGVGASIGIVSSVPQIMEEMRMVRPTILLAVPTIFNKIYAAVQESQAHASAANRLIFKTAMNVAKQRREELDRAPPLSKNPTCSKLTQAKFDLFDKLVFSKIRETLGGRIQFAVSGGAALHDDVRTFFNNCSVSIVEGYGLTETSPTIAVTGFGPTAHLQGGMRAFPGVTLAIMGPEGDFLKPGEEGEIVAAGDNIMKGYHNLPEATAETIFERDGKRYFRTGDQGVISPEGVLRITGRVKELYKLENGKWVAPVPIEMSVLNGRFVAQALLYGVNHPYNTMLVVPNFEALKKNLGVSSVNVNDPAVVKLVMGDIQTSLKGGKFKKFEIPARVTILAEEFTVENGLLTSKLSMKRNPIVKKHEKEIEAMYAGTGGHPMPGAGSE